MSNRPAAIDSCHPLDALLEEERTNEQAADDIVFVTYNFDPAFFETRLLGVCQATGAVTTVIADAHIWNPDPRALIAAGQTYHLGLASVPGAFHPKVMVITGPTRATIAIGSGNLTLGGWQYNAELSTVIRVREGTYPAIVSDIAAWLADLASQVAIDEASRAALTRSAQSLRALYERTASVDTGHRFVHNLTRPIIEQLPEGPVESLRLYAPFHDPRSQAIADLATRFAPDSLDLAVQPGYTVLNSSALRRTLERIPAATTVCADAEDVNERGRYRHGKLIEWQTGPSLYALTGSPNLSVAALARTAAEGNCETAVIAPIHESLFPAGSPIEVDDVPTVEITSNDDYAAERQSFMPALLGASITAHVLTVDLSALAPVGLSLEISNRDLPPDEWTNLGGLQPSLARHEIAALCEAGSRVRLRWEKPDGSVQVGPLIPIADPALTLRHWRGTESGTGSRLTRGSLSSLDMSGLNYLQRELLELARQLAHARPPRISGSGDDVADRHTSSQSTDADIEPWLWHEDAEVRMAEHLRAFALGLPAVSGVQHIAVPTWRERTDIGEVAADDEETVTDELVADIEVAQSAHPSRQSQRNDDADLRRRRREWCWKIEKIEDKLPLPAQMAALRVVLGLYCSGNWDHADDEDALALIHNLLVGLDIDEGTDRQCTSAASLAGVAIALMRDRMSFTAHTQDTLQFEELAASYSVALKGADSEHIDEYVLHMTNRFDAPLDADYVWETINAITTQDALTRFLSGAKDFGWDITRVGPNAVDIEGTFTHPSGALLRALTLIDDQYPVAIRTRASSRWAAAAWVPPNLYTAEPGRAAQRWRHWHLDGLMGPSAFASQMRDQDGSLPAPIDHGPQARPIAEALEAFRHLGLNFDDGANR